MKKLYIVLNVHSLGDSLGVYFETKKEAKKAIKNHGKLNIDYVVMKVYVLKKPSIELPPDGTYFGFNKGTNSCGHISY